MSENQNITQKYSWEILFDFSMGLLTTAKSQEIQNDIDNSEELSAIVEGIKALINMGHDSYDSFEAALDNSSIRVKELMKEKEDAPAKHRYINYMYKMAAAVLILIIPLGLLYYNNVNSFEYLLQQQLSDHYTAPIIVRGDYDKNLWSNASISFQEKDFETSITLLTEYLTINPEDTQALFYIGMSHLYLDNEESAIRNLESVINSQSRLRPQARWFKALALLRAGNLNKGKDALKNIANDPAAYRNEEASKLLESLD